MLFKLSAKNITKSIKDYAIYFFTLVLGVAIFYVFNAIESQSVMLQVSESTAEIIELMTNMLSGVSVFVSFILGFLIIYASRFLIKRRNKEFGIYLTLGMGKRKISLILFFETLIIGVASLAIGLAIGIGLSQIMSVLVANMFDADMTKFQFVFSNSACVKTLIYFGIMYLFVMLFNTVIIGKCKLIDLIHSGKKVEKIKMKNPVVCILVFAISAAMIGYGYYMVTGGLTVMDDSTEIYKAIALGAVGTFLLFWSLSGLILKIVMSVKKVYYKELNSFTLRQVSSKINTAVIQLTLICLMLFVTICVLSSALSIKNSMSANLRDLAPMDIQLTKWIDHDSQNKKIIKDTEKTIFQTLEESGFDTKGNLKDVVNYTVYHESKFTLKATLGDMVNEIEKQFKFLQYDSKEDIVKISDYNKIAKQYGHETFTLKNNEYMVVGDFEGMVKVRNEVLKNGQTIELNGKAYKPKYRECKDGFIEMSGNPAASGIFIVPDHTVEKLDAHMTGTIANYKAGSKEERYEVEKKLDKVIENRWNKTSLISSNSKIDIAEATTGLGALVTFIGLYLGIIFLMASAAVLALKELSEATDNRERYMILKRLGADDKMVNRALFRQVGIFFMFPLLIAIVHSVVGLKFCTYILETFGKDGLLPSIIMAAIFIVVIYGGYFLITYFCSKNIIREKR
ncbi:MAG: ABC transporter permease [Eubacterium sp.]|nr:ABC transporter permease [Eubacterium sp.]